MTGPQGPVPGRPEPGEWAALAREEIRDLAIRYNCNGDAGRLAQVLELFAPDAVMEHEGREHRGRSEIARIFTGTGEVLRGGGRPVHLRHLCATHHIEVVDDDHATGRLTFAAVSAIGLDHWGVYVDDYVRVGGAWRFGRRVVVVDAVSAASLFAPGGRRNPEPRAGVEDRFDLG